MAELIDTQLNLKEMLDVISTPSNRANHLYMDLEGNNLSRAGTLSLMTVLVEPKGTVYLVDVTTMGHGAFSTPGSDGRTLKHLLEADDVIKTFFDIRNDSDALYSLYDICVAGVEDIQLMELATRNFSKKCVNGLAKCIENNAPISYEAKRQWRQSKDAGHLLFDPARGGTYGVFNERPLKPEIQQYCVQDVQLLPLLRQHYRDKLCDAWWLKIKEETLARIALSQTPTYNGKGRHMALGPSSWLGWVPSTDEQRCRTLLVDEAEPGPADKPTAASGMQAAKETLPEVTSDPPVTIASDLEQQMTMSDRGGYSDFEGQDGYDLDEQFEGGYHRSWSDDSDQGGDLAACDKECGYCGRCMY